MIDNLTQSDNEMAQPTDIIFRISVFDNSSGIPLFDYVNERARHVSYDEILYTGALQGINLIIKEALNCGNIKELILENAELLMNHSEMLNVSFVMIAKKNTNYIRYLFKDFIQKFIDKYEDELKSKILVGNFENAEEIIEGIFPI